MPTKYPGIIAVILAAMLLAACSDDKVTTPTSAATGGASDSGALSELSLWRYVNSGWVSPLNGSDPSAFARVLKGAVITTAEEMDEFNRTVVNKRSRGTSTSLSRPEFPGSVVLAAYLMWLPVQGDPLSVVGLSIDGNKAVVDLELEEDAQGREYPYLFAPMTMVTVDRSVFPGEGPVEFEFRLDDETRFTVIDALE